MKRSGKMYKTNNAIEVKEKNIKKTTIEQSLWTVCDIKCREITTHQICFYSLSCILINTRKRF